MTEPEKKISFLNRYFIYKKIRTVNTENVELELGEYDQTAVLREKKESEHAQDVASEEVIKIKPKIRKLSKKLLLVAATEALDEPKVIVENKAPEKKPKQPKQPRKSKKQEDAPKKVTKALILNNDSDSDEE